MLVETLSIVRQQRNEISQSINEADHPVVRSRFVLKEIWLVDDLCWNDMECVNEIISHGTCVDMLQMRGIRLQETSVMTSTPILWNVFAVNAQASHLHGPSVVELSSTMDHHTASSILSTLIDSQSVREISENLSGTREARSIRIWEWLDLCAFSHQATNQLDRVHIEYEDLTLEDIAAMELLIQSANPLASFYGNPNQAERTARASIFHLSDNAGEGPELSFGTETLEVRVVDDRQDDYVGVFLTGYGRAWVPRSKCEIVFPQTPYSGHTRAIREIQLKSIDVNNLSIAFSLLRVIVRGMKHFRLRGNDDTDTRIPKAWIVQLSRTWPELEAFEMEEFDIGTLEVFSECFEQGMTKIHELSLVKFVYSTIALPQLFSELADETEVMTQHLTKLRVHLKAPMSMVPEIQESLHLMLCHNYYLKDVSLLVNA